MFRKPIAASKRTPNLVEVRFRRQAVEHKNKWFTVGHNQEAARFYYNLSFCYCRATYDLFQVGQGPLYNLHVAGHSSERGPHFAGQNFPISFKNISNHVKRSSILSTNKNVENRSKVQKSDPRRGFPNKTLFGDKFNSFGNSEAKLFTFLFT